MTAIIAEPVPALTGQDAQRWELLTRAAAGDMDAYGELWREHYDLIYRYVWGRIHNRWTAQDITGDVFLKAMRHLDTVTYQGRPVAAWLMTLARNQVADYYKKSRVRREIVLADMHHPVDPDNEVSFGYRPDLDPAVDPVAVLLAAERVREHTEAIADALLFLTAEQQRVIELRFYQELPVAQTAAEMGLLEGACKALQYRAVRALARHLPPDWSER